MSVWLVSWIVVNMFVVQCPVSPPLSDLYGREPSIQYDSGVACMEVKEKTMFKRFDSAFAAEQFQADGMAQCSECKDWKIIEIPDAIENPWEHFPDLPNDEFVIEEG